VQFEGVKVAAYRSLTRAKLPSIRIWAPVALCVLASNWAAAQSESDSLAAAKTRAAAPVEDPTPVEADKPAAAGGEAEAAAASEAGEAEQPKHHHHHHHHDGASKGPVHHGRQPTAEYRKMRDGWHAVLIDPDAPPPERIAKPGDPPPLVIEPVNNSEAAVTLHPQRDDGGFSDEELERAARAFAPKDRQKLHPIAPHLLDLVYRAARHFDAPLVHLISGYRPDRAGSRHTQGRAIDMVLPGVSNEDLAEYVRQYGFVGVGIYPKSGFVHLDVREASYFWLDESLPDEHCRAQPMLGTQAAAADVAARQRGEAPDDFVPNNDKEDRAAKRAYARRAKQRVARAAQVLTTR
jgi:uncharacterized protein YcbK (DUF882 family)